MHGFKASAVSTSDWVSRPQETTGNTVKIRIYNDTLSTGYTLSGTIDKNSFQTSVGTGFSEYTKTLYTGSRTKCYIEILNFNNTFSTWSGLGIATNKDLSNGSKLFKMKDLDWYCDPANASYTNGVGCAYINLWRKTS